MEVTLQSTGRIGVYSEVTVLPSPHIYTSVAQWIESQISNLFVGDSSSSWGTIYRFSITDRTADCDSANEGSIPSSDAKRREDKV